MRASDRARYGDKSERGRPVGKADNETTAQGIKELSLDLDEVKSVQIMRLLSGIHWMAFSIAGWWDF